MNREETLALYAQGRDAWNAWAAEMLAEKARLEAAGQWGAVGVLAFRHRPIATE